MKELRILLKEDLIEVLEVQTQRTFLAADWHFLDRDTLLSFLKDIIATYMEKNKKEEN